MMHDGLVRKGKPSFIQTHNKQRAIRQLEAEGKVAPYCGRIPRLAKLMALAVRFDQLLAKGAMYDQAGLAEVGQVTRARITQIMNLLYLAPDIQEEILSLPPVESGRDPVRERYIRHIVKISDWQEQRKLWAAMIH